MIDDLIDELDETLTWIQGSDYEHCLVRHIERAASLFTVLFCLEYEPDDSARLRAAKLERLIVKAGPSIAAIAKSYHLYPDFVQTIRPLIAASARIAKRKAAARLARQGKP